MRLPRGGTHGRGVTPFVVLALVLGAGLCALGPVAAAGAPSPSRLQVTASEFRLTLSRPSIGRGPAVIELYNLGEDDHDLALRRLAKGSVTRRTRVVSPGRLGSIEARLQPGRYALWCTLADHRARGMRATLVVRRRA
jgi:hypothetical protein